MFKTSSSFVSDQILASVFDHLVNQVNSCFLALSKILSLAKIMQELSSSEKLVWSDWELPVNRSGILSICCLRYSELCCSFNIWQISTKIWPRSRYMPLSSMQKRSETVGENWSKIWIPETKPHFYLLVHKSKTDNVVQEGFFACL